MKSIPLPVCTLSPICSSDMVTDLPFWRLTLAEEGKHEDEAPGAFVRVGIPSHNSDICYHMWQNTLLNNSKNNHQLDP